MIIFFSGKFVQSSKDYYFCIVLRKTMSSLKGLNDRIEILNELRFYLRHEKKLLSEGWITESDFLTIVESLIKEYAASLLLEK